MHEVEPSGGKRRAWLIGAGVMVVVGLVYYFTNPRPSHFYDYTFRMAEAMLDGRLGLAERPPSWLNEMIPLGERYYSAFPLGSVLTMLPVAVLKRAGLITEFPSAIVVAVLASVTALFFFLLSRKYGDEIYRRVMLALFPLLGTWMWCNVAFGGAWQIALGFAVLGQAGALYFTLVERRPFIAGCLFALAFGNRTETIILAPLFIYFLIRERGESSQDVLSDRVQERRLESDERAGRRQAEGQSRRAFALRAMDDARRQWRRVARFLIVPVILGTLTLAYNYARFSSIFDFGYARIPGVLDEPWYRHGIFSLRAIPLNAGKMLFELWRGIETYPYYVPTGWGGSILLTSPLLFLIFRRGARDRGVKIAAWIAIAVLTFVLWCHGNPGGWQYSYRYAMVLLPWMFLILLETGGRKASAAEIALFALSVAINLYGTYLFLWTDYVKP